MSGNMEQNKHGSVTKIHVEHSTTPGITHPQVITTIHLEGDIGPLACAHLLNEFANTVDRLSKVHETTMDKTLVKKEEKSSQEMFSTQDFSFSTPQNMNPNKKRPANRELVFTVNDEKPIVVNELDVENTDTESDDQETVGASVVEESKYFGTFNWDQLDQKEAIFKKMWRTYGRCSFIGDRSIAYDIVFPKLRDGVDPTTVGTHDVVGHDFPYCSCPSYKYGNFCTTNHGNQVVGHGCKHLWDILDLIDVEMAWFNWSNKPENYNP